jgi:hypothetical protein
MSLNSVVSTTVTHNLTPLQKERYASLQSIYNDRTINCITSLGKRGENSFNALHEKLHRIRDANYELKEYNDTLYSHFEIGKTYGETQLISRVAESRRDLNLPPYDKRIKQQCERDFSLLFLFTEVYETYEVDGVEKRAFKGYRPLFKIKPD